MVPATSWRLSSRPLGFLLRSRWAGTGGGAASTAPPPPTCCAPPPVYTPGRKEPSQAPPPWKSEVGHWCRSSMLPGSCSGDRRDTALKAAVFPSTLCVSLGSASNYSDCLQISEILSPIPSVRKGRPVGVSSMRAHQATHWPQRLR